MEEERSLHPLPATINQTGVERYFRDAPPTHYWMKIEAFSLLVSSKIEKYGSGQFSVGGYKWKLNLYPNGTKNGKDHISLYLAIDDSESLPFGWEIHATFKLFVFNHNKDKYLTIQDETTHQLRRFHHAKTEWGFDKLISLQTFNVPANGFLVNDSCIFGVEVFVVKSTGSGECITMKNPRDNTFTWKICDFSANVKETLISEVFTIGKSKWSLQFYPKGDSRSRARRYVSLFMQSIDAKSLPHGQQFFANFSFILKSLISDNHRTFKGSAWFNAKNSGWGASRFMLLSDVQSKSNGYLLNDSLRIEVEVTLMSDVKYFSQK